MIKFQKLLIYAGIALSCSCLGTSPDDAETDSQQGSSAAAPMTSAVDGGVDQDGIATSPGYTVVGGIQHGKRWLFPWQRFRR